MAALSESDARAKVRSALVRKRAAELTDDITELLAAETELNAWLDFWIEEFGPESIHQPIAWG